MIAHKKTGLIGWVVLGVCLVRCCEARAQQCADDNYRRTDKGWSFERKQVEGADLATFRVLTGPDPYLGYIPCVHDSGYAVDRFHVYWHGAVIPGAAPKTFSYLQLDYSRDAAHVFYRREIVSGADSRTFTYIDAQYFRDSSHVYLRGSAIKDAHPAAFSVLSKSWYLVDRLGRDDGHVFFGASIVNEASPKDALDLGGPYWRSGQTIFCEERPLGGADAASFHVAPKGEEAFWAEDKAHYFLRGQTLDKEECRKVGPAILACRNYVWVGSRRYSHFESASLHYLGGFPPKHCIYEGLPTYQDKSGVYFLDGSRMVERFLHSRQYPRIEHLDKSNADRLCHLGGTVDVWPDEWFDHSQQAGSPRP